MEDDKFIILLDKISEVSERTARMEVQNQAMERRLTNIEEEDRTQNELLAKHIQGTVDNRKRLDLEIENRKTLESKVEKQQEETDKRISKLEETPKFFKNFKEVVLYIAAVGGAIAAIVSWIQ